jgi:hypothetical protein
VYKYEFLDNSVPKGTYPKTIAFGTQKEMNILNPLAFINIERYQKIDVKAKSPGDVYPDAEVLAVRNNLNFLSKCLSKRPAISFVDETTNEVYLRVQSGKFEVLSPRIFEAKLSDPETRETFQALAPKITEDSARAH